MSIAVKKFAFRLKVGKLGQLILPNKLALEAACAVADPYRSWSR